LKEIEAKLSWRVVFFDIQLLDGVFDYRIVA